MFKQSVSLIILILISSCSSLQTDASNGKTEILHYETIKSNPIHLSEIDFNSFIDTIESIHNDEKYPRLCSNLDTSIYASVDADTLKQNFRTVDELIKYLEKYSDDEWMIVRSLFMYLSQKTAKITKDSISYVVLQAESVLFNSVGPISEAELNNFCVEILSELGIKSYAISGRRQSSVYEGTYTTASDEGAWLGVEIDGALHYFDVIRSAGYVDPYRYETISTYSDDFFDIEYYLYRYSYLPDEEFRSIDSRFEPTVNEFVKAPSISPQALNLNLDIRCFEHEKDSFVSLVKLYDVPFEIDYMHIPLTASLQPGIYYNFYFKTNLNNIVFTQNVNELEAGNFESLQDLYVCDEGFWAQARFESGEVLFLSRVGNTYHVIAEYSIY